PGAAAEKGVDGPGGRRTNLTADHPVAARHRAGASQGDAHTSEEVSTDDRHRHGRCPHPGFRQVHLRGHRLTHPHPAPSGSAQHAGRGPPGPLLRRAIPLSSLSTPSASALAPYGWDDAWTDTFAPHAADGLLPGRVIRVDRGQCDVVTAEGTVRADTAFV